MIKLPHFYGHKQIHINVVLYRLIFFLFFDGKYFSTIGMQTWVNYVRGGALDHAAIYQPTVPM